MQTLMQARAYSWSCIRYSWWGKILAECDTEPTELLMGGLLKWLVGVWLTLPMDSFSTSATFALIGQAIPEHIWAIGMMGFGAFHMIALRNGSKHWRGRASFIGCTIWMGLTTTLLYVSLSGFGAMLFFMAGVCQGWCYIRLRG